MNAKLSNIGTSGPRGANERVCVVEFEGTRDATEWMQEHEVDLRYALHPAAFHPAGCLTAPI